MRVRDASFAEEVYAWFELKPVQEFAMREHTIKELGLVEQKTT
jgi:hypothetical protein